MQHETDHRILTRISLERESRILRYGAVYLAGNRQGPRGRLRGRVAPQDGGKLQRFVLSGARGNEPVLAHSLGNVTRTAPRTRGGNSGARAWWPTFGGKDDALGILPRQGRWPIMVGAQGWDPTFAGWYSVEPCRRKTVAAHRQHEASG